MLTRRQFIKNTGLLLSAAAGSSLFWHELSPVTAASDKILVVIFQRGAMDGLMAVSPLGDPGLFALRPTLAMKLATTPASNDGLLALNDRFGIHPAFGPWLPLFQSGQLAVIHGVGLGIPVRSHFDAQDFMETATPGNRGTTSGWLNRMLGRIDGASYPLRAVALSPFLPRSLSGEQAALALARLEDFAVNANGQVLQSLYENATNDMIKRVGRETFQALTTAASVRKTTQQAVDYPRTGVGNSLRQIAQLIKANVGLRIATTDSTGWDNHVREGTINGPFARAAQELAGGVAAFWQDIREYQDRTVVLTMTEFGRTAYENGDAGTDHGRASCWFLLGGQVAGGKVYGSIPGLSRENLEDRRDLPVAADFRAVLQSVASAHMGVSQWDAVFPGWRGESLVLFK